jgi:UDP-N-acetyl-D-mannosaminuronic acid transferase (WecB/TagA/CpsF family)
MKSTLTKLYTDQAPQLVDDILDTYQQQQFCIINFIYFANVVSQEVFSESKDKTEKQKEYKKILLKSDFLLPDGIAVQVFYYLACLLGVIHSPRYRLENLNGTDFTPFFLEEIKKRYGSQKICLLLYGALPTGIEKANEYVTRK